MPLGGLIPYGNENDQTKQALLALLTPHSRARLGQSLGRQPEQYFPGLPSDLERPTDINGLASAGIFGNPDRFRLLLQLLQQRA